MGDPEQSRTTAALGWWLPWLAGLVALLSDLGAAIPGRTYFFRDFSVTFYPLRLFVARELGEGRVPFWNPYIYEGSFALPSFYPLDLLHALWPGPAAVSWLLTLHLPLAAVGGYLLARELGVDPLGGFVAGSVYSLGGLCLSSLNLYVFLQALALAPFVVLLFRRAGRRGGTWIAGAALALAVSLSTLAVEFVAQALALGLVLGVVGQLRGALPRVLLATALGLGVAAAPIAVTLGLLGETVRGAGFDPQVALGNEVHPLTLLQVLVPNLFGSPSDPVTSWWGGAFFSNGLPYFLSLYVGPLALALAIVGARRLAPAERRVLVAAAVLGLWYALGARAGLAWVLFQLPGLSSFRFPSKALLLPHLVVAILAGAGLTRAAAGSGWRTLRRASMTLGALLLAVAGVLFLFGPLVVRWARIDEAFFPAVRGAVTRSIVGELALLAGALALAALSLRGRVASTLSATLLALLVVLGLVRAGAGMNPQTSPRFFTPLPEMAEQRLGDLDGGRVFSFGLDQSPAFREGRAARGPGLSLAAFYLNRQLLGAYSSVLDRVEAAETTDLTSFVPRARELGPADYDPAQVGHLVPWLRNAAVSRVLSLDPLTDPALRLLAEVKVVEGATPIRVYALDRPAPRAYLACRVVPARDRESAAGAPYAGGFDLAGDVALEGMPRRASCREGRVTRGPTEPGLERYQVDSDGDGYLVARASFARGWRAVVDGRPADVVRANGKHRAVFVTAGHHEVDLRYVPPGLGPGLVLSGLALLGVVLVVLRRPLGRTASPRG